MKKIPTAFFITLLLALNVLALNANVHAAPKAISKQEAVHIATQAYPGRVLSVKRKASTYKVKTLSSSGKLRVILIDANTGSIQSSKKSSQ